MLTKAFPLLICAFVLLIDFRSAWAHAKLVRSDPAARATLKQPPERIRLWFNEKLEAAYATLELRDASGRVVTPNKARVSPEDGKLLELSVSGVTEGQYTVHYRVLSVDGHVAQSSFRFTVRMATR